MRLVLTLLTALALVCTAQAEPLVKLINFTADWCPHCQILNPRLDEAAAAFPDEQIELVNLDITLATRNASEQLAEYVFTTASDLADQHQVGYLWDQYGGVTGIAVIVASDTGETLGCVMRPMKVRHIEKRLKLALILAEHGKPNQRKPEGTNCPVLN